MKRILATTALVLILSGGAAYAEMGAYEAQPTDISASQFIGQRIYATDTMPASDTVQAGAEKDWDDIGEINELVLSRDGQVKAVVLGVGGFLGMGEKAVAVPMEDVKFVKNGDGADDFFLVVNTNKEELTAAPAFVAPDEKADRQAAANDAATTADTTTAAGTTQATSADSAQSNTAMNNDAASTDQATAANSTAEQPADTTTAADTNAEQNADTAAATDTGAATTNQTTAANDATNAQPKDTTTAMDNNAAATDDTTTASTNNNNATQAMTDDNRTRLNRPEVNREGYQSIESAELTADDLEGATVYGPNDEDVGEINRLILNDNGQVDRVVLDVGGFLGMGARQIAVTIDELNIVRNAEGDDVRVYIDANEAALKAQPEYKG